MGKVTQKYHGDLDLEVGGDVLVNGITTGLSGDVSDFKLNTLYAWKHTTSSVNNVTITLPYKTNSARMLMFTVDVYQSYVATSFLCSGYLYATYNNWLNPRAVASCDRGDVVPPTIVFGRDGNGYAYVSISGGNYTGVSVRDVTFGHSGTENDMVNKAWAIDFNTATPNIAGSISSMAYHQTNIVGTVSQTAGAPTGAIIESGSNSNGRYTKFADGTLICLSLVPGLLYTAGNNLVGNDTTRSFPHAFTAVPTVQVTQSRSHGDINAGAATGYANYSGGLTSTAYCIGYKTFLDASYTLDFGITATGRWF